MSLRKKVHHIFKKKKIRLLTIFAVFIGLVLVITSLLAVFHFKNKVLPNTYFSNFSIGGKEKAEVESIVGRAIDVYMDSKISVSFDGSVKDMAVKDLGISIDKEKTFNKVTYKEQLLTLPKFWTIFEEKRVYPSFSVDEARLKESLVANFGDIEKQSVNANVIVIGERVSLAPSSKGFLINMENLNAALTSNLERLTLNDVNITLAEDLPEISDEIVTAQLGDLQNVVGVQIYFVHNFDSWVLGGKSLYDMLEVRFSESGTDKLSPGLDKDKLLEFLASPKSVINKEARDATLKFEGGKVSEFTSAQDGQDLNVERTVELANTKLAEENLAESKRVNVDLPVTVKKARIANKEVNSLGIKELIGSGVSYFAGSIPNRVHNVGLGASLINGTIVPPGEVFSFVGLVGPVSAAQGFKSAYVIKSGRTVLDDGGGICQVSTTVFRAALNTGLPIVKRTAHAYRVSYYEQRGFKAGLDATIFSPTVDLQFKNDTSHHILVQTSVDKVNTRLQVDIYGTSDGRKVELSEPVVSNIKPAPEPKYEDDPTLPKGTVKQVDFAAAGATSVFTRKVYRGDEVIIDETFKSVFRPWQAVFLVGTAG